jgi:hypothetical protein
MVRLRLDTGTNLVILASADEVKAALQAAIDANEPMKVRMPDGVLAVDPRQVLYLDEGSERRPPPGVPQAVATLEVRL